MKLLILALFLFLRVKTSFAQPDTTDLDELTFIGCIEIPPKYAGGTEVMKKLLSDSMRYPENSKKRRLGGRVVVTYMVDKFGNTSNIKVSRSASKDLDEEAVRLIRMLKGWEPATLNGKKINYYQSQPFLFVPQKRLKQRSELRREGSR